MVKRLVLSDTRILNRLDCLPAGAKTASNSRKAVSSIKNDT
jgi:hypothetical protein